MGFGTDLLGKIRNVRLHSTQGLKPVFEAVANSIQSIEDAKKVCRQKPVWGIEIRVHRNVQTPMFGNADSRTFEPPHSFSITDNGIGFTEENFQSFVTADSRYKMDRGCKGVGRFLWLKAFAHAEIESIFQGPDKKFYKRSFRFVPTVDGVADEKVTDGGTGRLGTNVTLVGLKTNFQQNSPKTAEAIAKGIVEFCLPHFVQKRTPKMTLIDADDKRYDLNAIFNEMQFRLEQDKFKVANHQFTLTHLMVPASMDQVHRLHFCANGWTVNDESIAERMPELRSSPSPLRDMDHGGRQMYYAGFLSGKILDENVSPERIDFAIDDQTKLFDGENSVSKTALMEKVVERIDKYLTPHLTEIRAMRDKQVEEHVMTHSPQYRPLLKHRKDLVKDIPPNLSPEKLELKLYEANQHYNTELKQQYHDLLERQDKKTVNLEEHKKRVDAFLEEWNEEGMAKLAAHVAHRQATLNFLRQEFQLTEEGKYNLEDAIHKVIFPMKKESDDVPWEQQNLWIIDEKLTYHFYLSSDRPMNSLKLHKVDNSTDRPDLLVFNRPIAIVDSRPSPTYGSVVIFEFKRAMRDDYTEGDNPLLQVINYVRKLKTGTEKDRHGRPIPVNANTPYYGYVLCDMTQKLKEIGETYGLQPTPDGLGLFGYHKTGVYLEVIPFDKLLDDAQRRNARLFDLLGFGMAAKASYQVEIEQKPISVASSATAAGVA